MHTDDEARHTECPNAFRRWRKTVGVDVPTAARLLGKSRRIVEYYERGRAVPTDTRKLMTAIAVMGGEGEIQPWPETDTESRP